MTEVPGSHTLSPRGGNHGKPAQNMVTNSLICLSSRSGVCVLSPWEWVGSVTITNNETWQKQHCFSFQPGSFYFLSLGALNPHIGSPTTWGCHTMGKPKLATWRGFVEGGKGGERETERDPAALATQAPVIWLIPAEAPDLIGQKWAVSSVPCPNSWTRELYTTLISVLHL